MIVLPETRLQSAVEQARQLLTTLSLAPFHSDIQITASAGVTEVIKGETWSTWLNRADQALDSAKAAGRNQVVSLDGWSRKTHPEADSIAADIRPQKSQR
ncbi:diguanylate cyclase domain-containing protein [Marinobacter fonticola]|uniref:diguanylate cyclase domain-containing protein n=1 Tax=Marinobacter fonticola TaxID=2603215 RepID=UPI0022287A46|nr:diguanylate cyclase [Marinobacter fonticola]